MDETLEPRPIYAPDMQKKGMPHTSRRLYTHLQPHPCHACLLAVRTNVQIHVSPTSTPYLFSTNSRCIARYASTMNAPPYTASPMQSLHSAWTLKPKLLKMAEPGTSMSRPYLWSMRERYLTSFTMRPSKA